MSYDMQNARNDYNRAGTLGGAVSIGSQAIPQTEAAVPPVVHAVEKLNRNSAGLLDAITRLETRLRPVAPPVPEQVAGQGEKIAAHSLANSLDIQAERIAIACSRVESILSRLEL